MMKRYLPKKKKCNCCLVFHNDGRISFMLILPDIGDRNSVHISVV